MSFGPYYLTPDPALTMSVRAAGGTAKTNNGDYPGETVKMITIDVRGDRKEEADKMFSRDPFENSDNSPFAK